MSVKVQKCNFRGHPLLNNVFSHIIIVLDSLRADRCSRQGKGQDSRPGDAEREVLYAHGSDSLNVLLVVLVVLISNVVFLTRVLNQDVRKSQRLAFFRSSTLDLACQAGNAKCETRRKIVAVRRAKAIP